jgi:mono/diheme cytochrome c family protein
LGGKIPFPPEQAVKDLESKGYVISGAAIFPHGRSLERGITNDSQPRTLFSVQLGPFMPSPPYDPQTSVDPTRIVFVAYTPENHQLQLIGGGKLKPFDFRVVENYQPGNSSPLPEHPASMGLCLACHQGGGPIFPLFPWSETENNPDIAQKLKQEKDLDPFARYILRRYQGGGSVELARFDAQVRASNVGSLLAPAGRSALCQNICGESLSCRKALLTDRVAAATFRVEARASGFDGHEGKNYYELPGRIKKTAEALTQSARVDLVLQPSDGLMDRTPTGDGLGIGPGAGNDPLIPRPSVNPLINGPLQGGLSLFIEGGQPVKDEALAAGMSEISAICFPPGTNALGVVDFLGLDSRAKLYSTLESSALNSLYTDAVWPPTGEEITSALKRAGVLTADDLRRYAADDEPSAAQFFLPKHRHDYVRNGSYDPGFRAFILDRAGSTPIPHANATQLYVAYCASCHAGSPSPAPVLPLESIAALKAFVGTAGRTVAGMLAAPDKIMPPPGSLMPTDAERDEMLLALGLSKKQLTLEEEASQSCAKQAENQPISQMQYLANVHQVTVFGACLSCHSGLGPVPPHIPFSNAMALKDALGAKALYSQGTLYDAIIHRIHAPDTEADHMPMGSELTSDEKQAIDSYLKSLVDQPR